MVVRLTLVLLILTAAPLPAAVDHLVLDQMILPVTEEIVESALAGAEATGAKLMVIQLSTPGGLEPVTRRIVNRILSSKIPVVVWVAPSGERAASAGFVILLSADVAAMAPGTNTGAAHPVLIGVETDDVMRRKMASDTAAFVRTLAGRRGRNVKEAESAVLTSAAFTESEALERGLIDLVAADLPALLGKLDGREVKRFDGRTLRIDLADRTVRPVPLTLRQRVLVVIMDPNLAFILLSLGMLALWAEFQHPGAILPGVTGALAILVAVIALNMLPTRYAALALIVAAFAFFALEAKFVSHGVFGIAGAIAMALGGVLLVDGPIPEMRVGWGTALAVSIPLALIAIFLMTLAVRVRASRVTTGTEGMIGELGVAHTTLGPDGKVFVHGELWNAVAHRPIASGASVRVTGVRDLVVEVEPETEDSEPSS